MYNINDELKYARHSAFVSKIFIQFENFAITVAMHCIFCMQCSSVDAIADQHAAIVWHFNVYFVNILHLFLW